MRVPCHFMPNPVRVTAVLIQVLGLVGVSHADRLLTVPTGRKLPFRTVRYEFRAESTRRGFEENLLAVGIGTAFEFEARTSFRPSDSLTVGTFDVAYNIIAPIPDLSPGLSVGVQDVLNRTEDQRQAYFAATFRPGVPTPSGEAIADISIGILQGRYTHPFVGVSLPVFKEVRLIAEHNGYRPSAAIELRPVRNAALRMQFTQAGPILGLQLYRRF